MLEESRHIIREGKNLEMAAGANQINMAVNRVKESGGRNKENIDGMVGDASKFKVR